LGLLRNNFHIYILYLKTINIFAKLVKLKNKMEDTNFEGNFLKSHNENLNLFKELYSEYTLLKDKLNQLNINPNTLEATSEKNLAF